MKFKLIVFALFFSMLSFAQATNQNKPDPTKSQPQVAAQSGVKTECPCCNGMTDSKDGKPCCQHESAAKDGKDTPACCQGKDGVSCMKGDKAKSADAAPCCGGADQKGCCTKSEKTSEATTMACCGGPGGHCGMQQHEHADLNK